MEPICPICLDKIPDNKLLVTQCKHQFCKECYKKLHFCAICRRPITKLVVKLDDNKTISLDYIFC